MMVVHLPAIVLGRFRDANLQPTSVMADKKDTIKNNMEL